LSTASGAVLMLTITPKFGVPLPPAPPLLPLPPPLPPWPPDADPLPLPFVCDVLPLDEPLFELPELPEFEPFLFELFEPLVLPLPDFEPAPDELAPAPEPAAT
jgi:hypothetical protein